MTPKTWPYLLAAMLLTPPVDAGEVASGMLEQFRAGHEVLARAVRHAGGTDALRDIGFIRARYVGTVDNDMQAYQPPGQGPGRAMPLTLELILDYERDRYRLNTVREFGGGTGYRIPIDTIVADGTRMTIYNAIDGYTTLPGAAEDILTLARLHLPFIVLGRAAQTLSATTWIGQSDIRGAAADVIEVSWNDQTRYRLHVGRNDAAVLRIEYLFPDTLDGEIGAYGEFDDERRIDGLPIPHRVTQMRRGRPYIAVELVELSFTPPADLDRLFEPPAHYGQLPAYAEPQTTEVAAGIYDISDISGSTYRSQVVELDDFLVVFDAPLNPAVTRRVVRQIRRDIGDKAIRYVVLSHFHEDHIGGVRTYVDEGAIVMTSRENEDVVRRVAAAPSRLFELGAAAPRELRFEFVEDRHEIHSGDRIVEVLRFDEQIPHVAQMLVVHIPDAGVVLDADLFGPGVEWNPTYDAFLAWLKHRRSQVRRIVGVHHGPVSIEDIEQTKQDDKQRRRQISGEAQTSDAERTVKN